MAEKATITMYSVSEYAQKKGCTRQNILKKIKRKTLPEGVTAQKVGTYYAITEKSKKTK